MANDLPTSILAAYTLRLRSLPAATVLLRAIHDRGDRQVIALAELHRRCLTLTPEERVRAGLPREEIDHVP